MKNSTLSLLSKLLLVVGAGGVIGTAVVTAKCTPKAKITYDAIKNKDGKTKFTEYILPLAKDYAPALAMGGATILSILGSGLISRKVEMSLGAGIVALQQVYSKYGNKVKEVLGVDKHIEVVKEMAKDEYKKADVHPKPMDGEQLYFNRYIGFFYAKPELVMKAFYNMNMRLNASNEEHVIADECLLGYYSFEDFIDDSKAVMMTERTKSKSNFKPLDDYKMWGWNSAYLSDTVSDTWVYIGTSEKNDLDVPYTVIEFLTADPIYLPDDDYNPIEYFKQHPEEYEFDPEEYEFDPNIVKIDGVDCNVTTKKDPTGVLPSKGGDR